MKIHQVVAAGAVLALASGIIVLLRHDDAAKPAPSSASHASPASASVRQDQTKSVVQNPLPTGLRIPTRDQMEGQPALTAPAPSELATTESPALAERIGSPDTPPEREAKVVLDLLKLYRRLFGAYPAGENNSQIMNALLGANKQRLPLLPRDNPRLNAKGELVDAWGTPFFFHQNSRTSIEVRSAGADRLLYTDDDIVAGKPPSHAGSAAPVDTPPDS